MGNTNKTPNDIIHISPINKPSNVFIPIPSSKTHNITNSIPDNNQNLTNANNELNKLLKETKKATVDNINKLLEDDPSLITDLKKLRNDKIEEQKKELNKCHDSKKNVESKLNVVSSGYTQLKQNCDNLTKNYTDLYNQVTKHTQLINKRNETINKQTQELNKCNKNINILKKEYDKKNKELNELYKKHPNLLSNNSKIQKGSSYNINNINYKDKYIKYKTKYLNYKNN